ncbi:Regulator of RpoS [Pseudoalteromonas holothuriae]|uniref:diguanylate cyclase n=1 Tax=Pseudoalteromonas holothuriae TaxID=2963714 RepID=A0A9W4VLA0_9GAMM|nr:MULTISPECIES: diguanylate cyclase [unclassified Pseudoalteromonas]CAH9049451.1 Regulator of RpoS [Pseudoalteromonas sp. CIP111854]CAH9055879.1 Regulator of RpoS [Pseudoalteromonas sp. CIP111951]
MQNNTYVLVVDSDPLNRVVLENTLSEDCRIMLSDNSTSALQLIAKHNVDLIITDITLVDDLGGLFLQRLKESPDTYMIPVIIISSSNAYSDEVRGLQMGAVDYITKPFSPLIVKARVKMHLALKQKSDLLEKLASVDGLTELPNRRLFDKHFAQQWQLCQSEKSSLALLLVDIDYFKEYNDEYGYAGGDECLVKVAQALKLVVEQQKGFIARYDGVRFGITVSGYSAHQVEALTTAMHDAIDKLLLSHQCSPICAHVSISIGIVYTRESFSLGVTNCLQQADCALVAAHTNQERMVMINR